MVCGENLIMHLEPADQRRAFRANGFALMLFGFLSFFLPIVSPEYLDRVPLEWRGPATFALLVLGLSASAWGGGLYAKSKGYSGFWGLVMFPFLPVAGFAILYFLTDRWSPNRSKWLPEGNRFLVWNVSYDTDWEARAAMGRVWKGSLLGAMALASLGAFLAWGTHSVSTYTRDTAVVLAPLCLVVALPCWMTFAHHLARWKGYDPLFAAVGFVLAPVAFVGVGLSRVWTPITGYILLAALMVGPVFLLLAPRRNIQVAKSPFRQAPQSWYLGSQRIIPWRED